MRQFILFLVSILILSACSGDPRETKLSSNTDEWKSDQKVQSALMQLSEEEQKLFTGYIVRTAMSKAFGGEGLKDGMTIRQVLDEQTKWLEQKKAAEEKKKAELEVKIKAVAEAVANMGKILSVSMNEIGFKEKEPMKGIYSDYFTFKFDFKNLSTKNISGAKGTVEFKDIFDETIMQINLSNDKDIPANKTITWEGTLDYNQFMDKHKKLRSTPKDKLTFIWHPVSYVFTDGTKLEVPD